jgi:arylesterase / paraoxonase
MKSDLRIAFKSEMRQAKSAFAVQSWDECFRFLERAHILGQRYFITHVWTHLWMLRVAIRKPDWREIRGQIIRIVAVVPGYVFGWVPKGNTGGANVSALLPMPVPKDLQPHLHDYRVWADVIGRLFLWSIVAIVVAGFLFAADVWARSGEGRTIVSRHDGVCTRLLGVNGPEDIVVDPLAGLAYAVGGDRRALRAGGPGRAHIWTFSSMGGVAPIDVTPTAPEVFRSFGMDIHRDADGVVRLFVVNRADSYHGVEVFRVESDRMLTHERTLTAPNLINPNDVVAIDATSAYVTLDKEAPAGGLQEVLEGILERPTGRVALVTAETATIVASNLIMANGITFNSDRSELYVAEMVGQSLAVFEVDPTNGGMRLRRRIALETNPDNITLATDGRVLVAAHPKLLTLALGYQRSERIRSPSEVIAVDPESGRTSTVLVDNGELISGSSVAVQVPGTGRLLIGSAFAPYALVCDRAR